MKIDKSAMPSAVMRVIDALKENGFEAYIVGGALRDMFLGEKSRDFDIATDALPREVLRVFPSAKPFGDFGTVVLTTSEVKIEITPFRDDAPGRKPHYSFGGTIYTDLSRRDFTINSMAFDPVTESLLDPHGGLEDIYSKIIKATGSPRRIWEDPLRAMRAARFQAQLGFSIDSSTFYALKAYSSELEGISRERIRDELIKLVTGPRCYDGLVTLVITDMMYYIIPELMEGLGMMHYNKPMDVLEHNLAACGVVKNTSVLRLAALLHDIAKPRVAQEDELGLKFPEHHIASSELAEKVLKALRCKNTLVEKIVTLIRHHMFFYSRDSELATARRLVSKVGWDNIYDLIELRAADRIASGLDRPLGSGMLKLVKDLDILKRENSNYRIEDLAVTGRDLIEHLQISPGPQVGQILSLLLDAVLVRPSLNNVDDLLRIAQRL